MRPAGMSPNAVRSVDHYVLHIESRADRSEPVIDGQDAADLADRERVNFVGTFDLNGIEARLPIDGICS